MLVGRGRTPRCTPAPLTIQGRRNGPELDPIAWYCGNSGVEYKGGVDFSKWKDEMQHPARMIGPHPVGLKQPNPFGLYDMIGNIQEWCQDWFTNYPSHEVTDPKGSDMGPGRVLRGGDWNADAANCRSAYRGYDDPGNKGRGFRLARTLP
ncbi:MAG TPA: SUMF1/EgtB/PvdO family nonheme iron enzyme [Candidatus Binatia bacterium]